MKLINVYKIIKLIKVCNVYLDAGLTDLRMYNCLANNDDFKKVAALILMPTRPNY